MKVKALEGDTVDSLCFRYYGTTQGVTEKVLDANPGLCQQVFLDAGQEVEMPEPEKKKREMIQLWGSSSVHHSNRDHRAGYCVAL
ncbi:phage Tail Protein X family protein [Escherichia coli DEC5E]|uniref:tail protein X n=1 Tax=Escherichia coli TaxID=562 RepID=UPI000250D58D|nr:tail protein X [Escherichia coli]EHV48314.1 phage Tail Protein X family protein [Escherichia coli DEC5E]